MIVPPYLPDNDVVRRDILDYYVEIEHFDQMLGRALDLLEKNGEIDNTIVVVTSDHGMPFPRAKASLYDAGTRVPLAIRWPAGVQSPGRVFDGLVNLSDLAPTILDAVGLDVPVMMTGHSLIEVLATPLAKPQTAAYIPMERHDGCRLGGKGYPCRAIRTRDFLYIVNEAPQRWPAGDPDPSACARVIPFGEVDPSPTKQFLMIYFDDPATRRFHQLAFAKRPAEELYDLAKDPGQVVNVASESDYADIRTSLRKRLQEHLIKTRDPRALGLDPAWDYYPYYGNRKNKNWKVDARR